MGLVATSTFGLRGLSGILMDCCRTSVLGVRQSPLVSAVVEEGDPEVEGEVN